MRAVLGVLLVLVCLSGPALALWSTNPAQPLLLGQEPSYCYYLRSVSDGQGGLLAFWYMEYPLGSGSFHLMGQHLNDRGEPLWEPLRSFGFFEYGPLSEVEVCGDGQGGAYLVFCANVDDFSLVQALRLDPDGEPLWAGETVLTPGLNVNQTDPRAFPAADGGCLVTWVDNRNFPTSANDIYAQKITADGQRAWGEAGVGACTAAGNQGAPVICTDNAGGAFLTWRDERNYATLQYDLYGAHLQASGALTWTTDGLPLATGANSQQDQVMAPGAGGRCLVALEDYLNIRTLSLSAQSGVEWSTLVTLNGYYYADPFICADGGGGAHVAWKDYRIDANKSTVCVQHLDAAGAEQWTHGGVYAAPSDYSQLPGDLILDQYGLPVAVWLEQRDGYYSSVIGQRLGQDGERKWGEGGLVLATGCYYPDSLHLTLDARGGLVPLWVDYRPGTGALPAVMRTDSFAHLGDPGPQLTAVSDYPDDQGGLARVDWDRCVVDAFPDLGIQKYSVWRRDGGSAPAAKSAAADLDLPEDRAAALALAGWAFEVEVPACALPAYAVHCSTYGDSTAAGIPSTEFMVMAHGAEPGWLWQSAVLAGWSVDNLAPAQPRDLTALLTGPDARLFWSAPAFDAGDLAGYRVYRSSDPAFAPAAGNFLAATTTASCTDPALPGGQWYYRVSAVDRHGNEGPATAAVGVTSLSPAAGNAPAAFALHGAWPNPFNPSTDIAFDLPAAAAIRVAVYDLRGQQIRTLLDEVRPAGRHVVRWDGRDEAGRALASGVYLVRVGGGGHAATAKLMLTK